MRKNPLLVYTSGLEPTVGEATSWRDRAACRNSEMTLFFPDTADVVAIERAKQACASCPVTQECLSYAVATNETAGIWGGTTPGERRRLRRHLLKELREAG